MHKILQILNLQWSVSVTKMQQQIKKKANCKANYKKNCTAEIVFLNWTSHAQCWLAKAQVWEKLERWRMFSQGDDEQIYLMMPLLFLLL